MEMVAVTAAEQLLISTGKHVAIMTTRVRGLVVNTTTLTFRQKKCAVHAAGVLLLLVSVC